MNRTKSDFEWANLVWAIALACIMGCSQQKPFLDSAAKPDDISQLIKQISYEDSSEPLEQSCVPLDAVPFALDQDPSKIDYWDLGLDQTIQMALSNSTVLRDLGARVIQAPNLIPTIYGPSIQATDPRFGEEAALSAFDAQFATRAFFEKNDRVLNNTLLGGGTNFFLQDLWRVESEIRKQAATGTTFALRHNIEDDYNNSPSNIFGSAGVINSPAWTWNIEAEIRQPLLQGAGVEFNRIAGPNATPGINDGILIAIVNTKISAGDFQLALRDYLSNVENAYWELVYAYRELEVMKSARDRSLETWQQLKQLMDRGAANVTIDQVAQAAEQYFRYTQDVETALSGRPSEGTRDFNGSTGGTFQGVGGIYVAERRLRLIIGAPINDGRLIRPTTEPVAADIVIPWEEVASTSMIRRTELVQQRLRIKRRAMELTASENFLKPDLDLVGRYRRRGFGDRLYNPDFTIPMPLQEVDAGTNEWQIGAELNVPIGFRQAHAGVRNAQLSLARERALLEEMERQIIHDASNAKAELARTYQLVQTTYNRRASALQQYNVLNNEAVRESQPRIDFNILLDSERRLADSELDYHRALVAYAVSLKNVYLEMGSLMNYCNVQFADSDLQGSPSSDLQPAPQNKRQPAMN